MELPRDEMQVFEPRGQNHGMSDQELQDTIARMSDWSSDVPVFDVNEDAATIADDSATPSPVPEPKSKTPIVPSIANMTTGAQLAAQESEGTERLEPEEYRVGLEVEHVQYGVGTVVTMSGTGKKRTATVDFQEYGEKQFRVAFSNLRSVVT